MKWDTQTCTIVTYDLIVTNASDTKGCKDVTETVETHVSLHPINIF